MIRSRNIDKFTVVKQETIKFPRVATIAASVAVTTIQERIVVPYRHRLVGAWAAAGTVDDDAENFAVYNTEGTPAAVIALKQIVTADTPVYQAATNRNTVRAAGYQYTLRAQTKASTGGLDNLDCYLLVEKLDTNE